MLSFQKFQLIFLVTQFSFKSSLLVLLMSCRHLMFKKPYQNVYLFSETFSWVSKNPVLGCLGLFLPSPWGQNRNRCKLSVFYDHIINLFSCLMGMVWGLEGVFTGGTASELTSTRHLSSNYVRERVSGEWRVICFISCTLSRFGVFPWVVHC